MARSWTWRTIIGSLSGTTTAQIALAPGPGTVQRIIGDIMGGTTSSYASMSANFFYVINVGTAARAPVYSGVDPPDVMAHGAGVVWHKTILTGQTEIAPIHLDLEGQRVMAAGQSLWLRVDRGLPAIDWMWQVNLRVLVLDPEP